MLQKPHVRDFLYDFSELVKEQRHEIICTDEDGNDLSYLDFFILVKKMTSWLRSLGMNPGDTLVVMLPNSVEFVLLFFSCLMGGMRFSPIPCTSTQKEVESTISMVDAKLLIMSSHLSDSLVQECKEIKSIIVRIYVGTDFEWIQSFSDDINIYGGGSLVITTSGSTGRPKAILVDGNRLWSSGMAFVDLHKLKRSKLRFWNYLPMSYLGGLFNLVLIPVATKGSFVIGEPFSGKTFLSFWQNIERYKIDALWMVPSIVRGLIRLAELTNTTPKRDCIIRKCFLGTAPITINEKNKFSDLFNIEMLENYGLTETTFISSEAVSSISNRLENGVGGILPYVEVDLRPLKFKDNEISTFDSGYELWVRSPFLMLGYLNNKGELNEKLDDKGFFNTGDLAKIENKNLILTGRIKDLIKKGGYMIMLPEIERKAMLYPGVMEAAAVPIAHNFYGESYVLAVRVDNKTPIDSTSVIEVWLQKQIAKHKWPEKIIIMEDFPRSSSGKVKKETLAKKIQTLV